jgi:hypothetical protein
MIEGEWAGRVTGLGDQRVEIAMMRTPDGHGRLELFRFLTRLPSRITANATRSDPHEWEVGYRRSGVNAGRTAAVSPDGLRVAFVLDEVSGPSVWLRQLGAGL